MAATSVGLWSAALATTTIDTPTPPRWNGTASVPRFGHPGVGMGQGTATFGQTVTGPATDTTLDGIAEEQLLDLANAVNGVGTGTSLADKLASAQSDLAENDNGDACGTLNVFINQVDVHTPRKIPADVAGPLTDSA